MEEKFIRFVILFTLFFMSSHVSFLMPRQGRYKQTNTKNNQCQHEHGEFSMVLWAQWCNVQTNKKRKANKFNNIMPKSSFRNVYSLFVMKILSSVSIVYLCSSWLSQTQTEEETDVLLGHGASERISTKIVVPISFPRN